MDKNQQKSLQSTIRALGHRLALSEQYDTEETESLKSLRQRHDELLYLFYKTKNIVK